MANWYVDSAIASSGNGLSWSSAWKNFSNILWSSVQPGDTIYLSGGTSSKVYSEALIVGKAGTLVAPITIARGTTTGHNGTPIIDGGNSIAWGIDNGRTSTARHYITVRDITIRNFTSGCFGIRFTTQFKAINCFVQCGSSGSAPRAFDVRSNVDMTIRGCSVATPTSTPGQTDGIYSQDNSGYLYEDNYIDIANTNGTGHSDAYQAHLDGSGVIRNNVFLSPPAAGAADNKVVWLHAFLAGATVDFYNNICVSRGNQSNVSYWRELSTSPHGTLRIWNNTILGGNRCINLERVVNVEIKNNILVDGNFGVYSNLNDPLPGTVLNNLLFGQVTAVARTNALGNRTYSQWTTTDGFNANGVNSDPLFVDEALNNFLLTESSPAINAGVTLATVATDLRGIARPQQSAYDIGAYEMQASQAQGPTFHVWTQSGWVPPLVA